MLCWRPTKPSVSYLILVLLGLICCIALPSYWGARPRPSALAGEANSSKLSGQPDADNMRTGDQSVPIPQGEPGPKTQTRMKEAYGKLPLGFETNQGQTDSQVRFLSRGSGYGLFLTPTEAVLVLKNPSARGTEKELFLSPKYPEARPSKPTRTVLRMKLAGANPAPRVEGRDELSGKVNYFIGNDTQKWRTNISTYAKVEYSEVYPGVKLIYSGSQRQLEYDFVIAPGTDPSVIRLDIQGAQKTRVDADGDLLLRVSGGEIRQCKPLIYQEADGTKKIIAGRYVLNAKKQVGFQVSDYDVTRPLVIDPILGYSTYLGGGSDDYGGGIAVDSSGNAYVTGWTLSNDFPTSSPYQSGLRGFYDAFVTKINATGSALIYSTYIGGSDEDRGFILAVDNSGNAYVTGLTYSDDFPTAFPFQAVRGGGFSSDAFVTKLNAMGSALIYSTYLGGSSRDYGSGIAVDGSGNAYVTGVTYSDDFPTAFPLQADKRGFLSFDAFVTKFNVAGSALVYSTYLGGNGDDYGLGIAVDSSNNAYVTGTTSSTDFPTTVPLQANMGGGSSDAFVTKFNATGTSLSYSTFLGGNGSDEGRGIDVDASGNAYVTGYTGSVNFPTTIGAFQTAYGGGDWDAFVTKINTTGLLAYSSFLGGGGSDLSTCSADCIAVDNSGNAYVVGQTDSSNFPTVNPLQGTNGGGQDVFVTKVNAAGSGVVYSTYLGGSSNDEGLGIAVSGAGTAYITGGTYSTDFPTTPGTFQIADSGGSSAFVAKIEPTVCTPDCTATVPVAGTVNTPLFFSATTTATGCTVPLSLTMKRSPVWTGNQAGPQDAGGNFWNDPAFNDSQWSTVTLPDTGLDSDADDRYYHFHFTWDGVSPVNVNFATDDGLTVYVNGNLLGSWGNGWRQAGCVNNTTTSCVVNSSVPSQGIPPGMLKIGDNALAIDLWNAVGSYFYINLKLTGAQVAVTYDWDFGDGSTHSSQQNPTHTYTSAGSYIWKMTATLSGASSCVKTGTITVNTTCALPSITTQPSSQNIISSEAATLNVIASGTTPLAYQWYQGSSGNTSNPISGATSASYTTPALTNTVSYWVRVSNSCGNTDSNAATITVTSPQRRPLIFVAGIAGSRLDDVGGTKIWPPPDKKLFNLIPTFAIPCLTDTSFTRLSLDPSPRCSPSTIVVPDVIRVYDQATDPAKRNVYSLFLSALTNRGGYTEYKVTTPEMRTSSGCDLSQKASNPSLFVFAYDWRKGNQENATLLRSYVQCIQKLYDVNTDVDIVTHSQGGPLARRYLLDYPTSHHVKKFISIAAPWLGAPKAINVLETGQFLDPSMPIYLSDYVIDPAQDLATRLIFKALTRYYPGEHELIPSRAYFGLAGNTSPYVLNNKSLSYDKTVSLLDTQFNPSKPGSADRAFHDQPGQDNWHDPNNVVNTNVEYHHLYGIKTGKADTVGSVAETGIETCPPLLPCITLPLVFKIRPVEGDGTVPTLSASRDESLNAPGVSLSSGRIEPFYCMSNCNARDFLYDHTGLMNNADVQNEVVRILQSPFQASPQPASQNKVVEIGSAPIQPSYYLTVIDAASASIQENSGNVTNPLADPPDTNVPDVTSYIIGDKSFMAIMPVGQSYSITLRSDVNPMVIELTQGNGTSTTQAIRYQDFSVPSGVMLKLQITPQGVDALRYDKDADGTFESTVAPSASVTGSAAQDTDPPIVDISATPQENNMLVTISSSDTGSGVKATYYSLDGTHFQPYEGPFTVDPYQAPVVYAFGDDNVANRSSLITYYPSISSNQIDNAQFFVRQHYLDFLSREPDQGGLNYWTSQITQCNPSDQLCIHNRRIAVSDAFFFELEFQQTGSYVFRLYRAAYGDNQPLPNPDADPKYPAENKKLPSYAVFAQDRARVPGGPNLAQAQLALANDFVERPEFLDRYPANLTGPQFVDAVLAAIRSSFFCGNSTGVDLSSQRGALIGLFNQAGRGMVMYRLADDNLQTNPINNRAFIDAEYNPSFVLNEYFGYLRRDPDIGGFHFWLCDQVNRFAIRNADIQHAMVCSFITSIEYQLRFGSAATHSNAECPQ